MNEQLADQIKELVDVHTNKKNQKKKKLVLQVRAVRAEFLFEVLNLLSAFLQFLRLLFQAFLQLLNLAPVLGRANLLAFGLFEKGDDAGAAQINRISFSTVLALGRVGAQQGEFFSAALVATSLPCS
jgi:hypothetical protein